MCHWPHGHLAERKTASNLGVVFWRLLDLSDGEKLGIVFFSHSALFFGSGNYRSKYYSKHTPVCFCCLSNVYLSVPVFSRFFLFFPCLSVSKFFCFSIVCVHALSCRNTQPCLQSQTSMIMQIEGEPAS